MKYRNLRKRGSIWNRACLTEILRIMEKWQKGKHIQGFVKQCNWNRLFVGSLFSLKQQGNNVPIMHDSSSKSAMDMCVYVGTNVKGNEIPYVVLTLSYWNQFGSVYHQINVPIIGSAWLAWVVSAYEHIHLLQMCDEENLNNTVFLSAENVTTGRIQNPGLDLLLHGMKRSLGTTERLHTS